MAVCLVSTGKSKVAVGSEIVVKVGTVCHHTFKNSPTQTLSNGTLKLFYSNNAIPVLHHRPFLFRFYIVCGICNALVMFSNCKR